MHRRATSQGRARSRPTAARAAAARRERRGTYPAKVPHGRAAGEPPAGKTEVRETILLVEDEPAVRQLFAQALSRAGYRVYEARNGQEAVKVFDQHGEGIDLLLTDMRMPYMGGAELAKHLRARRRSLKLICVSGYPGADTEMASDFLAKPFSREALLTKVREVLDRK